MPNGIEVGSEMGGPPQLPGPGQKEAFGATEPGVPGRGVEVPWTELIRTAEREEQIRWVVRKAISEQEEKKDFVDYYVVQGITNGLKSRRYWLEFQRLFGEKGKLSERGRSMEYELKRLEEEIEARQRIQNAHALERKYAGDVGQYADMFLQPSKINFEAADMKVIGRAPKTGVEEPSDLEKHEEEFGVMLDMAMRGYVIVVLADTARKLEKNGKKSKFMKEILRNNFGSDDIQKILTNSAIEIDFGLPEEEGKKGETPEAKVEKKEKGFGKKKIDLQGIFNRAKSERIPNVFTGNLQDEDYGKTREFIIQEFKVSREAAVLAFNLFRVLNLATVFDTNIDGMPTSNDFIKMAHFEYKRAKEHAEFRPSEAPFPAGPPSTLGKYPDLITDFLHRTEVGPEGNEESLWQLWWHKGTGFGFLPWEEKNGVGKENFDFYRYVCWRAKNTYEDLVKKKDLRKFIEEGGFEPRNKNFDVTFDDRKQDKETGLAHEGKPKENPRVWYMIGMIYEHHPNGYRTPKDAEGRRQSIPVAERWNYLTADQLGKLRDEREAEKAVNQSVIYFLTMGIDTGFITEEEREFIEKHCKIEPKFLGLRW